MAYNTPDGTDGMKTPALPVEDDREAYLTGYTRTLREYEWARAHGWTPTERHLVVSLSQAIRVYSAARGGKPISGPPPAWLRGRADALRELLQKGSARE